MTDSSFYDKNWTVLNKIRYLEKWFKDNSIDLNTIQLNSREDGENVYVSLDGTNFAGEEISLVDILTYKPIRGEKGEQGNPLFVYNNTLTTGETIPSNDTRLLEINKITPSGIGVDDLILVFIQRDDYSENNICVYKVTSIIEDNVNATIVSKLEWSSGYTPSVDTNKNLLPYTVSVDLEDYNGVPYPINGNIKLEPGKSYKINGKYGTSGTPFSLLLNALDEGQVLGSSFDEKGGFYTGEIQSNPIIGTSGMGIQIMLLTDVALDMSTLEEGHNVLTISKLSGTSIDNTNNPIIIDEILDAGTQLYLHKGQYNLTIGNLTGTFNFNVILPQGIPVELSFEEAFKAMALQHGVYTSEVMVCEETITPLLPSNVGLGTFVGSSQIVKYPTEWNILTAGIGNTTDDDTAQSRVFKETASGVDATRLSYDIIPIVDILSYIL